MGELTLLKLLRDGWNQMINTNKAFKKCNTSWLSDTNKIIAII